MPRPALPMLAAKSSAACSDACLKEGRHVTRRQISGRNPARRAGGDRRWDVHGQGAAWGTAAEAVRPGGNQGGRQSRRGRAAQPGNAGAHDVGYHARADRQHGERGFRRLREVDGDHRHRLSCRGAGQESGDQPRLLASGGVSDSGRHQDHLRTPDGDQGGRRGQAPGRSGGGGDSRISSAGALARRKGVRYTDEIIRRKEGKKK